MPKKHKTGRLIFSIWLVLGVACRACLAQATTTPSAHFGALLFPRDSTGYEFGVHVNRFTEFDKKTVMVDGVDEPVRYNQIDKTFGFNLFAAAVTKPLDGSPKWLYRLTIQLGVTADQPTRYLQNDVIHDLRNKPHVPVGDAPTQFDADASIEITRWFGRRRRNRSFAGAGVALGTINQDVFLQTGFRSAALRVYGHPIFGVSGVARAGIPVGGRSFQNDDLASNYAILQGLGTFEIANSLSHGWLPVVELGLTYSTGFFVNAAGERIDELFWTIRFGWSDKFAFETWNDSLNDKDRGPTYGLRFTTAFSSIPALDGLL